MVDVVYYLDPQYIADIAVRYGGVFHSLHHSFAVPDGSSLCDTYRWNTEGDTLTVTVGNSLVMGFSYQHPTLEWLRQGLWEVNIGGRGKWLAYETQCFYGPMEYGCFVVMDNKPIVKPQVNSTLTTLNLKVPTIREYWWGSRKEMVEKVVTVDKVIYNGLLANVANRVRDDKLVRDCVAYLKRIAADPKKIGSLAFNGATWNEMVRNMISGVMQDHSAECTIKTHISAVADDLEKLGQWDPYQVQEDNVAIDWPLVVLYSLIWTLACACGLLFLLALSVPLLVSVLIIAYTYFVPQYKYYKKIKRTEPRGREF